MPRPKQIVTCAALCALLMMAWGRAEARAPGGGPGQADSLSSPIPGAPKTTYFDLLAKLFPGLTAEGKARETVPLGSLSEPGERKVVEGDIEFDFKPYWFLSGGRRLLLLRVDVKAEGANEGTSYEGEAVVLAVYRLGSEVELLDALEVKTDRFTGFWEDRPLLRLDPRNDAFIVYSTHSNAGESYISLDMLFVDAGRFKRIASRFVYNTRGCGVGFTETPYFRPAPDPGNKYPRVFVTVRLRKDPDGGECERRTRGYTRYYRGVYRWNRVRGEYETSSRQLEVLDEFDERRVSSP
jgi:hypothetical protein